MPPIKLQLNLPYSLGDVVWRFSDMAAILDIGMEWLQQF